jgi:hypothetical protein
MNAKRERQGKAFFRGSWAFPGFSLRIRETASALRLASGYGGKPYSNEHERPLQRIESDSDAIQ